MLQILQTNIKTQLVWNPEIPRRSNWFLTLYTTDTNHPKEGTIFAFVLLKTKWWNIFLYFCIGKN